MDKNTFNTIMTALDARVTECAKYFAGIKETKDLYNTSICDALLLKAFCQLEEAKMTNIVMVDTYHIIGMGDLTPVQMSQFTYKLKDYLQYRPLIKAISRHLDSINDLPQIPVVTSYKLMGLDCDITLQKGEGDIIDDANLSDYRDDTPIDNEQVLSDNPLTFDPKLNVLKIDLSNIELATKIISAATKMNLSPNNMKSKIASMGSYAGMKFTNIDSQYAFARVVDVNTSKKLSAYLCRKQ